MNSACRTIVTLHSNYDCTNSHVQFLDKECTRFCFKSKPLKAFLPHLRVMNVWDYVHGLPNTRQWAQVMSWGWVASDRRAVPGAELMCEPETDRFLDVDCRRGLAHGPPPRSGTCFRTEKLSKFRARIHNTHGGCYECSP